MQYIDLTSDEKGGLSIRASLDNSRIWIVPEETKITVYVPSLEALSVSGSGDFRCRRFENPGELALTISGSTDLKFDFLSATGLSVSAAGSCDLEFGILQAKTADMALAGSGDIEVSDLQSQHPLWTLRGIIIFSPRLQAVITIACTADVVPPIIKKACFAPKASAAKASASLMTETG